MFVGKLTSSMRTSAVLSLSGRKACYVVVLVLWCVCLLQEPKKDYAAVKKAIEDLLDADDYDDGSYGEPSQAAVLVHHMHRILRCLMPHPAWFTPMQKACRHSNPL